MFLCGAMRTLLKSGSGRVVARCAAILLLILTALPFTAPFATCELTDTALVMLVEEGTADTQDAKYAHAVWLPAVIFDLAPVFLLEIHSRIAEGFCALKGSPALARPLRL